MSASHQPSLVAVLGALAAKDFAAALLSGACGMKLCARLWETFPTVARADAYLEAVLALSLREADLVAAEIELGR
ncbi:hypothetical protein [Phenylobacterium sp.]|uniref:hypothetical protein n=1 Tax=Phenylobacterium sp. TaxID=1871053 RepID=UPI00374CFD6D